MIHIEFKEHTTKKYSRSDYTFIDCHTSEEIAFGSYDKEGDFALLSFREGTTDKYVSAAVAWVSLNRQLEREYGY